MGGLREVDMWLAYDVHRGSQVQHLVVIPCFVITLRLEVTNRAMPTPVAADEVTFVTGVIVAITIPFRVASPTITCPRSHPRQVSQALGHPGRSHSPTPVL